MNATDDPALANIAGQTFRLVRKGYDPEEVRTYLRKVAAAVERVPEVPAPSPSPATEDTVASDEAASLPSPEPGPDTDASGEVAEAPVDRWDGLGQHVARVLAQAESEANSMTEAARTRAEALTAEADADRIAARDHLAQSELIAKSIVDEAEAEAMSKRAEIEPQVRLHIAATLAQSQSELDETRKALRDARARLTDIHALVGRSLGEVGADPAFASPDDFLTSPAAEPPAAG